MSAQSRAADGPAPAAARLRGWARRFFLTAHPLLSLAETWVLGLLLLWALGATLSSLAPYASTNALLFLLSSCGMWCVLRTRPPRGRWPRQLAVEFLTAILLAGVMAAGLLGPVRISPQWQEQIAGLAAMNGGHLMLVALFAATGVGYFAMRCGLRVLLFWNRLRQRRLVWSITNVHLVLVAFLALAAALILTLSAPYMNVSPMVSENSAGWVTTYVVHFIIAVLPTVGVFAVLGAIALVVVLPPSALVSYFIARGTTRRLENLASAAAALRAGDYSARSTVEGADEVAQLQRDFNAMADQLERTLHDLQAERDRVSGLLEARRALVANVSHELRTPVATVRAALDSSIDRWEETPPAQLRGNLEMMQGEVLRLQALIDDLFTLSRADAGGLPIECSPTDIRKVGQRMVEALAPLARRSGRVELIADIPAGLPRAFADEGRLEQVLANLLRNAIRHTPPGGIVVLRAAPASEGVGIQVCDTGEGISAEEMPHIWERFYRGANGRNRDAGGAGLGLALVKELTEAMGGSVAVESACGEGACFTVNLRGC